MALDALVALRDTFLPAWQADALVKEGVRAYISTAAQPIIEDFNACAVLFDTDWGSLSPAPGTGRMVQNSRLTGGQHMEHPANGDSHQRMTLAERLSHGNKVGSAQPRAKLSARAIDTSNQREVERRCNVYRSACGTNTRTLGPCIQCGLECFRAARAGTCTGTRRRVWYSAAIGCIGRYDKYVPICLERNNCRSLS